MRLTDLQIQKLPIPEKGQKTYWEDGFGVRVSQGGSKTFVLMHGTDRKLTTIGRYPAVSLKTARREALRLKATDTPQTRLSAFHEARTAYLLECDEKNRPATVHVYRNYLNKLDTKNLTDITRADIDMNSPHAVTTWKVFFNWCIRNELVDKNPFAQQRVSYGERDRVLTDNEVKAIWHYDRPPYSDYLKLLILTGQRIGQFQQFTIQDNNVFFPAAIMKGKRDHLIPLGVMARPYFERLQPFNGWSKAKTRFDKLHPFPHWTLHDCRRYYSTTMASLEVPIQVTEAILSHTSGVVSGVSRTYNRYSYMKEARAAALTYERHIATIVGAEA